MRSNLPGRTLTGKEQKFCEEYIKHYNATEAVQAAGYKPSNYDVARQMGSKMLKVPQVRAEITRLQNNLEEAAGLSKLMILLEHKKIAFSSMASLHDTWIERKLFDKLSEEQKQCIQEISTQTRRFTNEQDEPVEVEFIKIKLYDKQRSLDSISKMLGYDAPTKIDLTSGGLPIEPPKIVVFNTAPPLAASEDTIDI